MIDRHVPKGCSGLWQVPRQPWLSTWYGTAVPQLHQDALHGGGPDEWPRDLVAILEVLDNGRDQSVDADEGASSQPLLGEVCEDTLDQVQPGGAGGHEVQLKAWVRVQPGANVGVRVRRRTVEHEMQREGLGE